MTSSIDSTLLQHSQCKTLQDLTSLDETIAEHLDAKDSLRSFREKFHLPSLATPEAHSHKLVENGSTQAPKQNGSTASAASHSDSPHSSVVYLCGNSLGLQPRLAFEFVQTELLKWQQFGVEGHFKGDRPWVTIDEKCNELLAQHIVGARSSAEVCTMNSLSVNLHLLLTSFYQPTQERHMIVVEEAAFCSDHHILRSQIALHGRTTSESLLQLAPREGEAQLRNEDVLAAIAKVAHKVAVVLLPGVQYYSGQFFDINYLTTEIKKLDASIYVGWDLAHAVGNVPLSLHLDQVDFAVWCSYKYLNSGPGAIGGAFVHEKHAQNEALNSKKLTGWWGQTPSDRFRFASEHVPKSGAQSYQLSNPPVLQTVCLQAALEVHAQASMSALREKSQRLTRYLELLIQSHCSKDQVRIITPSDPASRGAQLSLLFVAAARPVFAALESRLVICDLREPNVIRVSPAPIYNSFRDVQQFVRQLAAVLQSVKA